MSVILLNNFWEVDHPLVHEQLQNKMSNNDVLAAINTVYTEADGHPFHVEVIEDKRPGRIVSHILISGMNEKTRRTSMNRFPAQAIATAKRTSLLPKDVLLSQMDLIERLFPSTKKTYDDHIRATGAVDCVECTANGLRHLIQLDYKRNPRTREQLKDLIPHVNDVTIKMMCGESVSNEEILDHTEKPYYYRMKDYPERKREVFFESTSCGKGHNRENCHKCRLNEDHRKCIHQEYVLPTMHRVVNNDVTMQILAIADRFNPHMFKCPYEHELRALQPSLLSMAKNITLAGIRIVTAIASGKSIVVSTTESNKRDRICRSCEFLNTEEYRCSECACYLDMKIPLTTEDCPLNKWNRIEQQKVNITMSGESNKPQIWIAGYPSFYGGADTELDNNIDLWIKFGVEVHLVPMFGKDAKMEEKCTARGCITHKYTANIFKDKIVASFCNGEFLSKLPEIMQMGKPQKVIWFNCMTWTFPNELIALRKGWIDYFGFVSNYQKQYLLPQLVPHGTVNELVGYQPYLTIRDDMFQYNKPTSHFRMGRLSRDDGGKFSSDMWNIFYKVCSPIPTKTFIMGWGNNSLAKCGNPPNGLDWMTGSPNYIPVTDFYHSLHCIIHKTGGSRESYCRIVPEAYAYGVPIIVEKDYAFPELIIDGVTGFMCKTSDEMSYRASQMAFDEDLRYNIVTNAQKHLKEVLINDERCWQPWKRVLTVQ